MSTIYQLYDLKNMYSLRTTLSYVPIAKKSLIFKYMYIGAVHKLCRVKGGGLKIAAFETA